MFREHEESCALRGVPMAEDRKMAASEVAEEHQSEAHAPYLKVVLVWLVLTGVEYYYASIFKDSLSLCLSSGSAPGVDQGGHGRLVLHAPEI